MIAHTAHIIHHSVVFVQCEIVLKFTLSLCHRADALFFYLAINWFVRHRLLLRGAKPHDLLVKGTSLWPLLLGALNFVIIQHPLDYYIINFQFVIDKLWIYFICSEVQFTSVE